MIKKIQSLLAILFLFNSLTARSIDDCTSTITVRLLNTKGGVYSGQTVTLTARSDASTKFTKVSNALGEAAFDVPCEIIFEITVSNYVGKEEIKSPKNGAVKRTLGYDPDMAQKKKEFAMSKKEMEDADKACLSLPDTQVISNSNMPRPFPGVPSAHVTLILSDLSGKALSNELVIFTGRKRNKSIKGYTDIRGKLTFYIPKGDEYDMHFKHTKDYGRKEVEYSKGSTTIELTYTYLGTREIERRMKEEAERIAAEEKRLKAEREAFKAWCKKLKITEEEGHKRKLLQSSGPDTVVLNVLNRNKWSEKLIVCDLTGSMTPYASQLSIWYQLNLKLEKNLQFVFFNDGDQTPDEKKIIGETGGIYYSKAEGIDKLRETVAMVCSRGYGGDCPENNMEALIKGVKMAGPYKELVMIADNYAPVKDIKLLKDFNRPVHIIVCGRSGAVHEDYMNIAYKTKGTIHTMEEDITNLAKLSEGQEVNVGGHTYRIMGGKFVIVSKL